MYINKFAQYSTQLNVLLVDDNEEFREILKEFISPFFNNVDTKEDGEEALKQYKEYYLEHDQYYDLVITDVYMPNMAGEELIEQLKLINKNQAIMVISAYKEPDQLIHFIKSGVQEFLIKPIEKDDLHQSIFNVSKNISSYKNLQDSICKDYTPKQFDVKNIINDDDHFVHFDDIVDK